MVLEGKNGIGYRTELGSALLASRVSPSSSTSIDFLEVVAEACMVSREMDDHIAALVELWPIVPHGVKLSLGSAHGIEEERASRLGKLARALRAPVVTEHVALTSTRGQEIGHLTPIPKTPAAVRVVRDNVNRARRHLPDIPFLLENIAVTFDLPGDAFDEPELYCQIVEATGCDLLLDVANLYANAINAKLDPAAVARRYPLERVKMIHVAGGLFEDGFYIDTHADPVPDGVFELLETVFEVAPDAAIVLERDAHFDHGLEPLVAEIGRAHGVRQVCVGRDPDREPRRRGRASVRDVDDNKVADDERAAHLAEQQDELARILTLAQIPESELARAIGSTALLRTRKILQRKRVDDALPLLSRLNLRLPEVRPIAELAVSQAARGPRLQGIADAWLIANACAKVKALRDDALTDRLGLRACFSFPSAAERTQGKIPVVRKAPFVGREELGSGVVLWAIKGFGSARPKFKVSRPNYTVSRGTQS